MLNESTKSLRKMLIFGNVFELLINYFLSNGKSNPELLGPTFNLLDQTVNHLPLWIFNSEENFIDTNYDLYMMKNQLNDLINSKTVSKLFDLV